MFEWPRVRFIGFANNPSVHHRGQLPALGQGLLISSLARNQFLAAQIALFSGFLPAFMLSGFLFEIDSMPAPIRAITWLIPARYFVSSLKTVFLAGDIWAVFVPDLLAMAVRFGLTLNDLATMENVYSPAIGALAEPIATAANNGINNLRKA